MVLSSDSTSDSWMDGKTLVRKEVEYKIKRPQRTPNSWVSTPRPWTSCSWNESRFNVAGAMRPVKNGRGTQGSHWSHPVRPHESSPYNPTADPNWLPVFSQYRPAVSGTVWFSSTVILQLIPEFPSTYGAMTELIPGLVLPTSHSLGTHRAPLRYK